MTISPSQVTPTSWAQMLLGLLGMPVTTTNVQALTAWEEAEGGNWHNSDAYNPLNTTEPEPGAVSTNSAGVKAYTSWDQGLGATVATLQNGAYGSILSALQAGSSAQDVVNAVLGSPWGTQNIQLGGQTYTGGVTDASSNNATQASDPLGIGAFGTTVRKVTIISVLALGAAGLVVVGLLRGTAAGRAATGRAEQGAKGAAMAAAA